MTWLDKLARRFRTLTPAERDEYMEQHGLTRRGALIALAGAGLWSPKTIVEVRQPLIIPESLIIPWCRATTSDGRITFESGDPMPPWMTRWTEHVVERICALASEDAQLPNLRGRPYRSYQMAANIVRYELPRRWLGGTFGTSPAAGVPVIADGKLRELLLDASGGLVDERSERT